MLDVLNERLGQEQESSLEEKESPSVGLSHAEAERRLQADGANTLGTKRRKGALKIFAGQFHDIMVMILLIATVISVLLGQYTDAVPMILIVVINALLGFIQEYRCERTLEKLEQMTAPAAMVYRDGRAVKLPAEKLVTGDVFLLEAGDRVPADGYLISCKGLKCDEALLTGETLPADKKPRADETDFACLNKPYMVYMGSVVTKGKGMVLATSTGKETQMGRVSKMLEEITEPETPLQKKLGELGKVLALICIGVCFLVFGAGLMRGEPLLDMVMTGITIAIAAIPEGLPATVTIALALSVRRMLRRNALVHRLHSVETLGCATVICTDKTGTVTKNKMTVTRLLLADGREMSADEAAGEELRELFTCGALCTDAAAVMRKDGSYDVTGDPTECAIAELCAEKGFLAQKIGAVRVDELPFDSESRSMTVTCKMADGRLVSYRKGSPDVMIGDCGAYLSGGTAVKLDAGKRISALKEADRLAAEGLRVLAFSYSEGGESVYLGLMAMEDPPREEAAGAVLDCKNAGIRTVMITGDHRLTAAAVARQAGIMRRGDLVLTGAELDRMDDEKLASVAESCSVYARVTPAHKLRIVRALRSRGHICAMTGDGVNDAPAVKEADIGVSMGLTGTEVTKQAADVILLDDNFATLVSAVEEGRTIYANIRKFVRYLISCNIGEVLTMLGGMLMGLPMVLLPTQILLVNLVTDSLPALALGLEPPEESVMRRPPRREEDSFFSGGLLCRMIFRGILIGLCTLGSFTCVLRLTGSVEGARTGALMTLVLSQLLHVFECKSEEKSILTADYLSNPFLLFSVGVSAAALFFSVWYQPLRAIFRTGSLTAPGLLISVGFSVLVPLAAAVGAAKKPVKPELLEVRGQV